MKVLIAYYSRTGTTEKVVKMIENEINADVERIDDDNKYKGAIGYMKGGLNAASGRMTEIKPTVKNPLKYDLTVIATPVWASRPAPGVMSYIHENKKNFTKIAGIATCKGSGGEKTLDEISNKTGKTLKAGLVLTSADIAGDLNKKINSFIDNINK